MIEVANKYKEELKLKFFDTWNVDKYKYWQVNGYNKGCPEFPENDYNESHFAITNNGEIIGHVLYYINRQTRCVYGVEAVNFSDNKILFGLSLLKILRDVFEVHNMNKINFNVVVGNPIEKSYNSLVEKYGGKIVGVWSDEVILPNGELRDLKSYEITIRDYNFSKMQI